MSAHYNQSSLWRCITHVGIWGVSQKDYWLVSFCPYSLAETENSGLWFAVVERITDRLLGNDLFAGADSDCNFHQLNMCHATAFGRVCLSVCRVCALTFESLDLETVFLLRRYIFRIYRSFSCIKVIGSRLRSQWKNVILSWPKNTDICGWSIFGWWAVSFLLVATSAMEVLFSPMSVCLFVCLPISRITWEVLEQ